MRKHGMTSCLAGLLAACLLLAVFSGGTLADGQPDPDRMTEEHRILENMRLTVDGRDPVTVKALHYNYRNNRYVSVRDFAAALDGTGKCFQVVMDGNRVSLMTGEGYTPAGGEGKPFPDSYVSPYDEAVFRTHPIDLNPLEIDGRTLHYRTLIGYNPENRPDCFISLTDLIMQLDVKAELKGGDLFLNTRERYSADPETLLKEEFYYETHSALLGDASTGEVFLSFDPEVSVPIASTSKLMTYLVLMDGVSEGRIRQDDAVQIPEEAAYLSRTTDGVIILDPGTEASFTDLVTGMLVPSSDECALALAIHAAGSEEAFVAGMNRKAEELGLSKETVFFNCHGIPTYTDDIPASKVQNRMSAQDMFILVRHILEKYPEILEITSKRSAFLESFGIAVENTNPLLYNVPGVVGLKTGTTNMAGDCVIGVLEAEDPEGRSHYVTVIQFGAEDETIRATLSEELIRYGKAKIETPG